MIFIFGGKFQGKEDFALTLGAKENIVGPKEMETIIWEIVGIFEEAADSPAEGASVLDALMEKELPKLWDKVLIMEDISQGLVPMDPKERAYREASGRLMTRLAKAADEVYRVFCGIPTRLK